ncbi:hypothetical protein HQ545_07500 [Candidatus Woesearchaeota archaeon]|nr:hypothetical protein [Candidatus Woesearchaeota archaeon]
MAFEIISDRPVGDFKAVSDAIMGSTLRFMGELGCAEAGIIVLRDQFDTTTKKGLIRVGNKSLDRLRASLSLITNVGGQDVIFRSMGASGMIKKAISHYL